MKKLNEQKLIERYLDGTLDAKDRKAFEMRIKAEPSLAREVAVWQTIMRGLEEELEDENELAIDEEKLQKGLDEIHAKLEDKGFYKEGDDSKTEEKSRKNKIIDLFKRTRWFFMAAGLIGVFIYIATNSLKSGEVGYVALNEKALFGISSRGAGNEKEIQGLLQDAFDFYNNDAYSQAVPLFKSARAMSDTSALDSLKRQYYFTRISVYLACSYLLTEQGDKAVHCLEPVYQNEPMIEKVRQEVMWYLSGAYIKVGREEEAILLLELLRNNAVYGDRVAAQIEVLREGE